MSIQKSFIIGLMLGSLSLFWWSGTVFLYDMDHFAIPEPSIVLLIGALAAFIYSLKDTRDKDPIERYYWRKEDI